MAEGDNLKNLTTLGDDTICQHVAAASTLLRAECGVTVPVCANEKGSKKSERLHPCSSEILGQRRTWGKKQSKKEPLAGAILDAMEQLALIAQSTAQGLCSEESAAFDFVRLAAYTGSRLSEHGQSALPNGTPLDRWAPLPRNRDAPDEWRDKPAAFVASDFEFHDAKLILIPHRLALRHSSACGVRACPFSS